jgi:hypothetical protein
MKQFYIELWDVLGVFSYSLLQYLIGLQHAWPVTAVAAGLSSVDRDMLINEIASAAYMLRQACGAARVTTGPTVIITMYAGFLAFIAHTDKYLSLHHMYRRASVLSALATSTLLLHGSADPPWLSVLRLLTFVATTRYDITILRVDPWDSTAQKVWLLIVPWYAMILAVFYPVLYVQFRHSRTNGKKRHDPFYEQII